MIGGSILTLSIIAFVLVFAWFFKDIIVGFIKPLIPLPTATRKEWTI